MFIAALFIVSWMWKQPRYPSTDEWIKKLWHIDTTTGILLSHKMNEFESILVRSINLKSLIQSEERQKGKNKYLVLTHKYGI